ncbi:hypothetical protein Taro_013129 [Colocasia esculenta]|uniref:START domain-containing protein n=1 Tax=Colocasia esculenta TaxID=4460 RepID=A0A843UL80_COLES|nr:hypothetical protein [Colocasia esculenta]
MAGKEPLVGIGDLAGRSIPHPMEESWRSGGSALGGWATAFVLLFLLFWQLLRAVSARRQLRPRQPSVGAFSTADTRPVDGASPSPSPSSSSGISEIMSEEDFKILINNLEGNFDDVDRWEDVIDKKNDKISYNAKCCKPKDGPLRYLSVTTFEKCSVETLRDFYMDNEYRKEWDKTLVDHEQLEIDVSSGTEVGRMIKKFPLLSPREYVLAWRVWEGKNKSFYCLVKGLWGEDNSEPNAICKHHVVFIRSSFKDEGWEKVPDRDACEIKMVHQEDAGLNIEMAKLAFAKGIWSYICKMNTALHEYSSRRLTRSASVATSLVFIQVPPGLEDDIRKSSSGSYESSGGSGSGGRDIIKEAQGSEDEPSPIKKLLKKPSKTWIAKSLLVIGGIVCLSRGHSALGGQVAMACILKKLMKHEDVSSQGEPARLSRGRRSHRHRN